MIKGVMCGAVLTMACAMPAFAQEPVQGCDAKELAVQQQLEYAQAQGNQQRIKGLKRALHAIQKECSKAVLLKQALNKVEEKSRAVIEHKQDLIQAQQVKGDDDIEKMRHKLAKAEKELLEAKRELERTVGQ